MTKIQKSHVRHGLSRHPLYGTWGLMVHRCTNENSKKYKHYGFRGIVVCDLWLNDGGEFVRWGLENGWVKGLTIERKDVNGNYCPENCTFTTRELQNKNTTKSNRITIDGITDTMRGWALRKNINHRTVWFRVQKGMSVKDALTTQLQQGIKLKQKTVTTPKP